MSDIDALLASRKQLATALRWATDERGTVTKLIGPVLLEGVVGGLVLHAHATLHTVPQRGGLALVLETRPIQRLSFRPDHGHFNPLARSVPSALRGLSLPADRSRLHPWRLNRAWPRLDNAPVAELLDTEPPDFAAAAIHFLHLSGIDGVLPPPPWEPRLL